MKLRRILTLACVAALAPFTSARAQSDSLDAFITGQITQHQIPGLSLAIIRDGRIAEVRAYGTTSRGGTERVTPETLFQAGAISQPVAALGALRLVQANRLSLDEDVNTWLRSWKVPANEHTRTERVTLRRMLNHTAGLTGTIFNGYPPGARIPSTIDILEGRGNTPAVRVDMMPGLRARYSGGGYVLLQQLMMDATGLDFATYMQGSVLRPLGMVNSTYAQPLPPGLHARAARGTNLNREDVEGGWRTQPEQAVAGLWTTPIDLARYAIGVHNAAAGKSALLSREMASQMLMAAPGGTHGLGPMVSGGQGKLKIDHSGRNEGFDAALVAYVESGDGVAIMMNANDNTGMLTSIVDYIAKAYDWPRP